MPINGAVLALILIFIPGIICYGLVATVGDKRKRDNTTILLQIFMYGVASYLIPHDSPHFQTAPKVSAKTLSSASIAANRSINGSSRNSGIVGINS